MEREDDQELLREAINAANAHPGSDGIRFGVMARSVLVGVLPNARLIRESVRRNYRTPANMEEVSEPCATYL
jgi:hypothetical protein